MIRPQLETNPTVIARREKQIAKGKNTASYRRYTLLVPRCADAAAAAAAAAVAPRR